jgi:hypothetical protein
LKTRTVKSASKICFAALCGFSSGCPERADAPAASGCVEFDRVTRRDGHAVTCRLVWCEKQTAAGGRLWQTGGPAALWCNPLYDSRGLDGGVGPQH